MKAALIASRCARVALAWLRERERERTDPWAIKVSLCVKSTAEPTDFRESSMDRERRGLPSVARHQSAHREGPSAKLEGVAVIAVHAKLEERQPESQIGRRVRVRIEWVALAQHGDDRRASKFVDLIQTWGHTL